MNDYKHIPASGFISLSTKTTCDMMEVRFNIEDIIHLSVFSVVQLLAGCTLVTADNTRDAFAVVRILAKLQIWQSEKSAGAENPCIPVTRAEVKTMIHVLQLRMAHCEKERDLRTTRNNAKGEKVEVFNPDTYIGQKLLLIDLREWLIIEETINSVIAKVADKKSPVHEDVFNP